MQSQSVNGDDMGSLDRIDSLDEYFMLNSPPESPNQPNRAQALGGGAAAAAAAGFDIYGYYSMSGNNAIASQANVKQSTSNITVDRSNALGDTPLGGRHSSMTSGFGHRALHSTTQRDIDEMLKTDDKEFNLSELFLQPNHRSSLNSTYKAKGALKGHDKELRKNRANSLSSSFFDEDEANNNNTPTSRNSNAQNHQKPSPAEIKRRQSDVSNADASMEDFDLGVEPTPLSEIRAKQEQRQRFHGPRQQQASNEASQQQRSTSSGLTSQQLQHHTYQQYRQERLQHSNYYPFGRSYQLPIPTMPPVSPPEQAKSNSQPGSPMLADAVATAAALASVQDSDTNASSSVPNPIAPKPSNSPHRHRTPPHSPELQANGRSSGSWHGSRPQSRNSNKSGGTGSPNRQSQSPNRQTQQQSYAQYQQHPAYPPQQQQQQHSHSHHQAHHHSSYHNIATPLAVGGSYPAKPKIVGPYTTAQQEGNNIAGGARRRTSAGGMSTSTTVTSNVTAATNSNQTTAAATSTAPAPAPASTYLPRRGHHMPREAAAAHTTPKGALEDAAKARRGYSGFHKPATSQTTNNYHHPLPTKYANYSSLGTTAPSGGPPPTISYTRKSSTDDLTDAATKNNPGQVSSATTTAATASAFSSSGAYASLRVSAAPSPHPPADTAYERKKQRAKDARVKLNESIERLHVSMGVAGTESKKRVEQLRILMKQAGRSTESTTDHQAFQLMESCVKTAESAKKWDRPNFVGSAATMIECLNSQCEILMKELLEFLQDESRPPSTVPPAEADSENKNESGGGDACNEEKQHDKEQESELSNGKRDQRESLAGESSEELSEKRRRLNGAYDDEEDEKKDASSATDGGAANLVSPVASKATIICTPSVGSPMRLEESTMDLIASFLDPLSVVQCLRVCKSWRGESSCFAKAETWTSLCIKRFGVVQVRKWREKENEDDDYEENDGGENARERRGERSDKMLRLYREMARNNVMPPLQADSGERILVGETRLQTGVAAWMFLVERSNGETMRSLKRNPDEPSSSRKGGIYTSAPVVELRIVIQNIGGGKTRKRGPHSVIIKNQQLTVDASTRRRGEEFPEISWDDRFRKKLLRLDGSPYAEEATRSVRSDQLAALDLFESVVLDVFIHAKRCSTSSKFLQRSNFLRILVSIDDKTQAVVVPIKAK